MHKTIHTYSWYLCKIELFNLNDWHWLVLLTMIFLPEQRDCVLQEWLSWCVSRSSRSPGSQLQHQSWLEVAWNQSWTWWLTFNFLIFEIKVETWSLLVVSACQQWWSSELLSSVQPTDTNPWNIPVDRTLQELLFCRKLPTGSAVQ